MSEFQHTYSGGETQCTHCRGWTRGANLRTECPTRLRAEVERLRYLLKKATGIIPRDVAEATVFSQRGELHTHKFQHKYADEAACGYRPRGPYQPLKEEDLTCPDCIDVIRAVGLASETVERGEHRREEAP
jgi:hypothetical protein